jgi:hypothetical protein
MARRILLIGAAAAMMAAPASAAGVRIIARGGFGYGYGPGFYPWGYYDPFYYGGFGMAAHPSGGSVKLETKDKDAEVFINGAYAGRVGELKSLRLRQGTYDLEIRAQGMAPFDEKVYVVNGKTIHVRPDAQPGATAPKS